jgi:hypothetical protein
VTEAGTRPLTVDELERWVDFGAKWRAVRLDDGLATIELCQCTGELVELRESGDPGLIAYVRSHPTDWEA